MTDISRRAFSKETLGTLLTFHWFKATSETAFLFNIHVLGLKSGTSRRDGRVYIDPNGEPLSGDRIRARKLKTSEAIKLYG